MLTVVDKNTPRSGLDSASRPILTRDALLHRIRRFESQMVQRAHSRVLASRQAAASLHSVEASTLEGSGQYGIGGVGLSDEQLHAVLQRCREQRVGAHLGAEGLDAAFAQLLHDTVPPEQRDARCKPGRGEDA